MQTDDAAIAASWGTPEEFTVIFDRHFGTIQAYLRRRLNVSLADELASETFMVAFDRRLGYDLSRSNAKPWLFGIATNLLRNHLRKEARELRTLARSSEDSAADEFELVEMRADALRLRPRIAAALTSLSESDRNVLLLYAWADLSYGEIAEALGIPPGTVKSRLSRVRRQIREQLGLTDEAPALEPTPFPEVRHG
jgi:RNA polymerase sigma-70 factor, ECF subfamily